MLKLIKKIFISTMMLFGSLSNVNLLKCISMGNQECKVKSEIVNVNSNEPLVLKRVNVVIVVTIKMIHMQNYVLLILLKI